MRMKSHCLVPLLVVIGIAIPAGIAAAQGGSEEGAKDGLELSSEKVVSPSGKTFTVTGDQFGNAFAGGGPPLNKAQFKASQRAKGTKLTPEELAQCRKRPSVAGCDLILSIEDELVANNPEYRPAGNDDN